jgi:hypothetical protein
MKRINTTLPFDVDINCPVADVFSHLSNPRNFLGLQPLLIDMSAIIETMEDGALVRRYTTTEEFRFLGFLRYLNRIDVSLRLTNPPARMDAHVDSPGNVTLDVEYHFSARENGTHLREIVHIQSPHWATRFVISEATKAQRETLARLKARLETL